MTKPILTLFALALSCGLSLMLPARAAQDNPSGVYPVPHDVTLEGGIIAADGFAIKALTDDKATIAVLNASFKKGTIPLTLGLAANPELTPRSHGIPDKTGAYRIIIGKDGISLIGHDDTGLYYAAQTLVQLARNEGGRVSFPLLTVTDWPDIPFRGTVEGFYGRPWSFEDRVSQFRFYGKYKLNTYIYGPKDDPYHGFSNKWREPYPADQAKKLAELVTIAKQNKVNFVWAMHPGRDIAWGEADRKAALKKFEMMYDLGFRSFGVFFDDIGGTAGEPEGQVEFLNYLNREFIHKKSDVTPLVMCPTQYSGGGGPYHEVLKQGLDKDIDIMWTGNAIVSDITREGLERINGRTGRPVYIWWNFPVTDYVRHALFLGRVYGLDKGTKDAMSGFVSNPMDKPEASKIALFSIADFTWNQEAFNSDTSWKEGIKALFPACAEAMQTFADHNSDAGPSFHNYRREESVDIAPVVARMLETAKTGDPVSNLKETAELKSEFEKIAAAPAIIRDKVGNPAFVRETEAWLRAFEQLGQAGLAVLEASREREAGSLQKALDVSLAAADALVDIDEGGKQYADMINKQNGDNFQKPVKTGFLVMRPAVDELLALNTSSLISSISGRPSQSRRPYASTSLTDGIDKMFDDDRESYFYCREILKKDDYFGVDLGSVQEIRSVHLLMGRKDGDTDAVNKGQLEASQNGKDWFPLLEETAGLQVDYEGSGKKARFVRYRCTQPGIPGGKPDVWTAIRDFKVNAPAPASLVTNLDQLKNLLLEITEDALSVRQLLEVAPVPKGGMLGITIPAGAQIASLELDLKTPDLNWAAIETTADGKTWRKLAPAKSGEGFKAEIKGMVKGVRLTNTSFSTRDIYVQQFRLVRDAGDMSRELAKLTDENLTTRVVITPGDHSPAIPCPLPDATGVVIVSDGTPADVYARGASDSWSKIGSLAQGKRVSTVNLERRAVREIQLRSSSGKPVTLAELIWK